MENQLLSLKDYFLSTTTRKILSAICFFFFVVNIFVITFVVPYVDHLNGDLNLPSFFSDFLFTMLGVILLVFILNQRFIEKNDYLKSLPFHIKKVWNNNSRFEHFFSTILIISLIYLTSKILFGFVFVIGSVFILIF